MGFYLSLVRYYVVNMLPGVLGAVLLFGCLYVWRRRRLRDRGLGSAAIREGALLLFWMFCGGMAVLTLTPWGFHWVTLLRYGIISDQGSFFALGDLNLIPFQSFDLGAPTRYTLFNILGNLIMFLPFGFFSALLWRGYTWRRSLVTGAAITGFIECWQLLVGRAFDIDDLILNTLGVLTGFWLLRLLEHLAPGTVGRFRVRKLREK